ncbi:MAG: glycoside hydrolase family 2 TIM barrel-domain containing protein [Spirochaetales bacterium]|nr:glycoside hydrolase family 2 TIM barrel-domain containing protein [Spirochaetales bacterium]
MMKRITDSALNEGWEFYKGDLGGIWESCRPAEKGTPEDALIWEDVTLPHCFNSHDCVDPDVPYYQGAGWYRKDLLLPNPFPEGRTFLHFEGAGQICDVYAGTEKIAEHTGGYDEWKVDITDHIPAENKALRISIRCSNERNLEIIPSDLSDFNLYGGLYRPVHIVYEPPIHMETLLLQSRTAESLKSAELTVRSDLNLCMDMEASLEITDPEGTVILNDTVQFRKGRLEYTTSIDTPRLWSPDTPALYKCNLLLESNDDQVYSDSFGLRHFKFEKHGPFYLNGKRLLLKGTHRHEDHAGLAAAMPDELIRQEMEMIKSMGANFIRLGHYQQSRRVLELCDRLGILVWEEIPWCRGGLGGESYRKMGREMLKNMILQHYNHPSVILWGLGNENDWPGDFDHFQEEEIRKYMTELHDLSHSLDSERLTSIRRCDFCKDIPDVYSPSIWAGWYRGHYREYRESTLKHIQEVDHFLHVEWGASSHAGRFSEDPYLGLENLKTGVGTDERGSDASLYGGIARVSKDGNWSENYACDLFDWTLKEQETMSELTGTAFWPFKDFATPLRPENPVPYVNQKGVVERDLSPKESFYVVQSYWSVKPMLRIFGHKWTDRWGKDGELKEFRVYSNCPAVELFLDGISLGTKTRDSRNFPAAGLRWLANLNTGEHELKAVVPEENLHDSLTFQYHRDDWGEPAALEGSVNRLTEDTAEISVRVVDQNGKICLDCEDYAEYSLAGKGELLKDLGNPGGSRIVQLCNGKSGIKVLAAKKKAVIAVSCGNLTPLFITV